MTKEQFLNKKLSDYIYYVSISDVVKITVFAYIVHTRGYPYHSEIFDNKEDAVAYIKSIS